MTCIPFLIEQDAYLHHHTIPNVLPDHDCQFDFGVRVSRAFLAISSLILVFYTEGQWHAVVVEPTQCQ